MLLPALFDIISLSFATVIMQIIPPLDWRFNIIAAALMVFWNLTWRDKEDSSEIFIVGDLQDLPGDIHQPAWHWRNPPEIQDPANQTTYG